MEEYESAKLRMQCLRAWSGVRAPWASSRQNLTGCLGARGPFLVEVSRPTVYHTKDYCVRCWSTYRMCPAVGGTFAWLCDCPPPQTYTTNNTNTPPVTSRESKGEVELAKSVAVAQASGLYGIVDDAKKYWAFVEGDTKPDTPKQTDDIF